MLLSSEGRVIRRPVGRGTRCRIVLMDRAFVALTGGGAAVQGFVGRPFMSFPGEVRSRESMPV